MPLSVNGATVILTVGIEMRSSGNTSVAVDSELDSRNFRMMEIHTSCHRIRLGKISPRQLLLLPEDPLYVESPLSIGIKV